MKRLAKVIGIIAGIGTILWMLRDRLVTLTVAREPQPPIFRTPPAPPMPSVPDDLTQVKGIGPTYADRLNSAGISRFGDLASASASRIAAVAKVSADRAQSWIEQAAELASSQF